MTTSTAHIEEPRRATQPPLENGDHLTAAEFVRRRDAMPDLKNAQLIEGVAFITTAVPLTHGDPHACLAAWLGYYRAHTFGIHASNSTSLFLDHDNLVQPDMLLRIPTSAGGKTYVDEEGYLHGPPELIAEVAASSASMDLHQKLHVYRRHGVPEYIVWRVLDGQIDWFTLHEGRYDRLAPDKAGVGASRMFPGLRLDAAALIRGDLRRAQEVVDRGANDERHAAFVKRLAEAGKRSK